MNSISRYIRLLIFLLVFDVLAISSVGQGNINQEINLPKVLAVSPEAASLGKFGQIPVSYYRGVPNVSIPLFQVKEGGIELPIQLSYHASGIKVEEMASNVGLAWALSAGGMITRSQKGLDDEIGFFQTYNDVRRFVSGPMTDAERDAFKLQVYRKYADSEPDVFYYNFGGISGKFFCADNGRLYTSPRTDLQITYSSDSSLFTIIDGKGIKYKFSSREVTTNEPFSGGSNNDQFVAVSAWYLTRIDDPNGNRIELSYTYAYPYFKTKSVTTFNLALTGVEFGCQDYFSASFNQVSIVRPTISEISFSTGKIKFDYQSTARLDAPDNALKQITLLNLNNDTVKYFKLYTGYYTTNNIGGCEDGYGFRLRLDSLQEFGINGKRANPYKFWYNADDLPCRLSNAQDHWGYYNAANNITFVRYQHAENGPWVGADKEPAFYAAKAGLLEKLYYPTGGRTEFTYEQNVVNYSVPEGFDPTHPVLISNLLGNNSNHGGNYLLSFQTTFSVTAGDLSPFGYLLAKGDLSTYITNPSVLSVITIQITGSNGYNETVTNGESLQLPVGSYTITGSIETEYPGNPYCEFNFTLNKIPYNPITYYDKPYGGVRIGQIRDYNELNEQADIKTFKYTAFDMPGIPTNISSGEYSGVADNSHYSYTLLNCPPAPASCCNYRIYNSISNYPLVFGSSSPVGYKNVTVYHGPDGTNGKQEYTFTSYSDYPDNVSFTAPFFFASEYDWRKGLLLKSTDYKYQGGSYFPVLKKENAYDFHFYDTTKRWSRGVVLGKTVTNSMGDDFSILYGLQVATYDVVAEAFNISTENTTTYDQESSLNVQTLSSSFTYSPKNFQLKRKLSVNSKGEQISQNFKYAMDYTPSGISASGRGIWIMQNKNMISLPIESVVTRIKGGVEYMQYGNINLYNPDRPLVDAIYAMDERGNTLLSNFQYSDINGSNEFTFNNTYKPRIALSKYTSKGKNSELNKVDDQKLIYIWDYNGELPIAEVTGADSASIAYTSFESNGKGNWVYTGNSSSDIDAPTGKRYYSLLNGTISKAGLNGPVTYTVSYWKKDNTGTAQVNGASGTSLVTKNGWTLYKHQLSGVTTVTVNGSGSIDELRLYPAEAKMTTHTYEPLIGLSSQCNGNNQLAYYEYDELRRLSVIRDEDRKVVKKICYNYAGQQEDCGLAVYQSGARSGTFTRNNCIQEGVGSSVTYTVPAGSYISVVSQQDADQLAQNDVNANGQYYANTNGTCIWFNQAQSGNFTRNNCTNGGAGGTVTYTVAANTYSSTTSLAAANQLAINAVNANGQSYANANASCTWFNQAQSGNFTRNNCANGGAGGTVTYTVAANTYSSTTSLAAANQLAINAVNANGQSYANANASCTWYNQAQSGNFTRNNCTQGGTGGTITYTVPANTYSSTTSLADANQLAINDVNANGQSYTNTNSTCTWYNEVQSGNFTRNNCPANHVGGTVTYTVPANTYSSTISLANANLQASNAVSANGQTYANTYGSCTPVCVGCNAINQKCINGNCETGVKVCTDSYYDSNVGMFYNTYHYEFSDGSWSSNVSEYDYCDCPGFNCV